MLVHYELGAKCNVCALFLSVVVTFRLS